VICFRHSDDAEERVDDAECIIKENVLVRADHFGDDFHKRKFLGEQVTLMASTSRMNFMFSASVFCCSVACSSSVFSEVMEARRFRSRSFIIAIISK
jgi:hypothetical protein